MYNIPDSFDCMVLVGHTFEMVCFAQNAVYFHLDRDFLIRVESAFSYNDDPRTDVPVKWSCVMNSLGSTIRDAYKNKEGTLTICLDSNNTISILDSNTQYESYIISMAGLEIIV